MPLHSILIVEDERIVAIDIQETLSRLGYDAFGTASSAEEAIAQASERCPDLVLMDIRIKGRLDGIDTADILRRRFDVPVVYLTAHADDATIERAKRTEPLGYVLKPVKPAELRSVIEVAIYRHAMERHLRQRERWFSTTLGSIADAVIAVDLSGRITFMNPAAETLTGVTAAAAIGRPSAEIVHLLDAPAGTRRETPLDQVLRERQAVELAEATLRTADAADRLVSDSASPVMDQGELLGAVMVFRDVTERRLAQKAMELADRLASLGTMAAAVAHEINNPLAVVVADTELVVQDLHRHRADLVGRSEVPASETVLRLDEVIDALSDVQAAAARITKIVTNLRAFSRPPEEAPGVADVSRAISWAIRTTAHEFKHRARLVTSLADVPKVRADEARLSQVVINLLINAAQAIEPGNAERNEVSITTSTDSRGRVVVEVRDTGAGIPPGLLGQIFDPFFTTKPVGVGTGLGLSICRSIVAAAGGHLKVDSAVGRGTAFRIVFPPAPAEGIPTALPPAAPRGEAGRVLAVDDEPMILTILRRALEGHDVVCVESARDALRLLEAGERFDVILSDLVMPDMTGAGFYEALLRSGPEEAARIVFLTGGPITNTLEAFLLSVPNLRIEKPFDLDVLRGTVQQLVTVNRAKPHP